MELAVVGELAEHRNFDIAFLRQCLELLDLLRRNREAHALLRFRNQNFPRLETGVFHRGQRQIHPAAVAEFGHFADARRKPPRAVVGDETVEAAVARLADEVAELLLGDRVADLHRLHRAVLVQFFAGKGRAVDAVLADPAAAHHDQVAGLDGLACAGHAVHRLGQSSDRAAVDQRLADVTRIEILPAVAVRDAGLVAAVDHALVDAVAQPPRMQQPFRHIRLLRKRRTEAVAPDVDQQIRPLPGAERVAVHADDAGHRAAVGIERGGAVMGFDLIDEVELVVEIDHAGVILENRHQPVDLFGDLLGALLDKGLVAGDDLLFFTGLEVFIVDFGAENLVLAVFAPGLGEDFKLHIGRIPAETVTFAVLRVAEVVLDRLHFVEGERERPLAAQLHQPLVRNLKVVFADLAAALPGNQRQVQRNPAGGLFARHHQHRLDQLVRQQLRTDRLGLGAGQFRPVEQILGRTEHMLILAQLAADDVAHRRTGGTPDVVGHARLEADHHQKLALRERLEILGFGRAGTPSLQNRIVEQRRDLAHFRLRQRSADRVDVAAPDFFDRIAEEFFNLLFDPLAAGIAPLRQRRNLNPIIHQPKPFP